MSPRARWALALFAVALLPRVWNLDGPPLWVDEVFYADGKSHQHLELVPAALRAALPWKNEWAVRLPFALAGALTAGWLAWRGQKWAALVVAVFPLFVFWSRMARPYSLAGLFATLGWTWWPFSLLAVLCTPMAVVALPFRRWSLLPLALGVIVLLMRPQVENYATFSALGWSRFWYLPALAVVLWGARALERPVAAGPGK